MKLNQDLMRRARRSPAEGELSEEERIAINLLWREGARAVVLARIFQCSKNTIYYQCLTGEGSSYPPRNKAAEINDIIEAMGEKEARERYLTQDMIDAVNAGNEDDIEAQAPRTMARR